MKIEFEGHLSEAEYFAAQWLHIKPRPIFAVLGLIILSLAVWMLWEAFFGSMRGREGWSPWVVSAGIAYLLLVYGVWQPMLWRKHYRQYKALQRVRRYVISESGLNIQSDNGSSLVAWSDFIKWKVGNGVFLLYPTDVIFHVLPLRLFSEPDQISTFKSFLAHKVGK